MKKNYYLLVLIAAIVILSNTIQAQTLEPDNSSINAYKFEFPPLDVVIDSVMKRSAMINYRDNQIGVMESKLKSSERDWTKNFGFIADTRYGTFDNYFTNSTEINSSASSSYTEQFNYTLGLYLKIPVFDFLNRKNKNKQARLEIEEAKSMADFQKEEIRKTVIMMYQDLILKQKLLQIRSRRYGNGKVNMEMIEKEFRNGVVPLAEYVRIVSITENMEAEYETAMSEFITAKQLLEDMAGFTFGLTQLN